MTARVLFVCTGNSARSQMAEGFARSLAAAGVEVASAGTQPAGVNPLAIAVMRERGVDISGQRSKGIEEAAGEFDYVITLCDAAAQGCPSVQARRERLHWALPDPAIARGAESQQRAEFCRVRDEIERRVWQWLGGKGMLSAQALAGRVRAELERYEHPLFGFEASPASDGVEVEIRLRANSAPIDAYRFLLRPREIENAQFPWTFQKQLYDCLHDYLIEMFIRNPQQKG